MAAEGAPFIGFLYAGLMIDRDGAPKVIEFNVRFGDPETQPIMMRLQSDLVELIEAALAGRLRDIHLLWDPRPAIGVVMAAHGYPGKVRGGDPISGLDLAMADVKVFHAGTPARRPGRQRRRARAHGVRTGRGPACGARAGPRRFQRSISMAASTVAAVAIAPLARGRIGVGKA